MKTQKLSLNQMSKVEGGMTAPQWMCNGSMAVVAGVWGTAAGMVTMGAGFAVGIGMSLFGSWVCSHVSGVARPIDVPINGGIGRFPDTNYIPVPR